MFVRALITIEGVIEEMCRELDLLELVTNKMKVVFSIALAIFAVRKLFKNLRFV